MTDLVKIRRALISVSDKSRLTEIGQALADREIEILSTGGTAKTLIDAGIPVTEVADYTNFPEMMDGRVKTLHPHIHGGLLGLRDKESHIAAMEAHGIQPIDLVIINLYPFEETVAKGGDFAECIENIDIGGPAMIRSAAKNQAFVTIVTDIWDYDTLLGELDQHDGATTSNLRRALAARAFARTAHYDTAISNWFADNLGEPFLPCKTVSGVKAMELRYGENPHQTAALYLDTAHPRQIGRAHV